MFGFHYTKTYVRFIIRAWKVVKPVEKVILHSDMNNFYASVACMLDPSLRDKTVAVCGATEDRNGIVLAKNQKAKALGIETGEVIWQAKMKCPDLTIVPPQYEEYLKYSALAKEIYYRFTHQVESYGMDECWLDVTGSRLGTGREIAEKIRQATKKELGLTVSIGVSFNKIFAKLGSDLKKPDAVSEITKENFREVLWNLPVSDLLGVGKATAQKLHKYNVKTIGTLANLPEELLSTWLGVNGLKLKRYALGQDQSRVQDMDETLPMKSISNGITAVADLETPREVWCLTLSLAQRVGGKLRNFQKKAAGVSISVKTNGLVTEQWQKKLEYPTQSPVTIAEECFALFQQGYDWHRPIRAVSVRGIYLEEASLPTQLSLYSDLAKLDKREKLDKAIQDIRHKFGEKAINHACLLHHSKIPSHGDTEIILPTGFLP